MLLSSTYDHLKFPKVHEKSQVIMTTRYHRDRCVVGDNGERFCMVLPHRDRRAEPHAALEESQSSTSNVHSVAGRTQWSLFLGIFRALLEISDDHKYY